MPGRLPPVPLAEVLGALKDPNLKVRRDALKVLGKYKSFRQDERTLPALIEATRDKTLTVVRAAMRTMSKIGDPHALEALPHVLKRPHSCSFERSIEKWVTSFGLPGVPYLIKALEHPKPEARRRVLWLLGVLKAPESFEVFSRALEDPDHTVQACAIRRLASLGDTRAAQRLLEILHGDDFDLPADAARALGELLKGKAADHLLPMLQHRSAKIRHNVAWVLLMYCTSDARVGPAVVTAIRDEPNPEAKLKILCRLPQYPHASAKGYLLKWLSDPDPHIRRCVAVVLRSYDVGQPDVGAVMRHRLEVESDEQTLANMVYGLCEAFMEADIPLLEALIERQTAQQAGAAAPSHLIHMSRIILQKLRGEIPDLPRECGQINFYKAAPQIVSNNESVPT